MNDDRLIICTFVEPLFKYMSNPAPADDKIKGEDRIVVVSSDCPQEFLDRIKTEAMNATSKFNSHREMYFFFLIPGLNI